MVAPLRMARKAAGLNQGWLVVAVLFFVVLVSAGSRSSFGIFLHPLLEQLESNRAAVSLAYTLNSIVFGVAQPLVGRALDRYGLRAVTLLSAAAMALGFALLPAVRDLGQLYLVYGALAGLGMAGTSTTVAFPVALRWIRQRRGPVLGVLAAAGMVGSFALVPGSMFLLLSIGWQGMLWALAGLAVAVALPVALVPPAPPGGSVRGSADAPTAAPQERPDLARLLRSRTFWFLVLPSVASGFSGSLVQVHFVPMLLDHGEAPQFAANALGIISAVGVVAVLAGGFLAERVGFKRVLVLVYMLRAGGLLLVPFVSQPLLLAAVVGLVGLSWGGVAPATSGVASDAYGRRWLGTVLGWIFFFQNIVGATAAVLGGAVYDWLGSYDLTFALTGLLLVGGGLLTAAIAVPARAAERTR